MSDEPCVPDDIRTTALKCACILSANFGAHVDMIATALLAERTASDATVASLRAELVAARTELGETQLVLEQTERNCAAEADRLTKALALAILATT